MNICGGTVSKRVVLPLALLCTITALLVVEVTMSIATVVHNDNIEIGVVIKFPYRDPAEITLAAAGGGVNVVTWDSRYTVFLWISVCLIFLDVILVFCHVTKYRGVWAAGVLVLLGCVELVSLLAMKLSLVTYLQAYFEPYYSSGITKSI